jgi:hypothetical protein
VEEVEEQPLDLMYQVYQEQTNFGQHLPVSIVSQLNYMGEMEVKKELLGILEKGVMFVELWLLSQVIFLH